MRNILFFALLIISVNAFSQKNFSTSGYKTNGFWDNWFINPSGGASMYFGGKQYKEAKVDERLTWGAGLSIGKWITPVVGARLSFQGGQKHTFNERGSATDPGHKMSSDLYISAHADALLNLSNFVAGYKENRFYNLIPYIGLGIASDKKNFENKSAVATAGLLNTFKVSKKVAITLDISGQAVQSKFNNAAYDKNRNDLIINGERYNKFKRQDWDGIGSVLLGLSIGLGGKQNFEKPVELPPVDTSDLTNQISDLNQQVSDLTNQVSGLESQNKYLTDKLKEASVSQQPTTDKSKEKVVIAKNVPVTVEFKINQTAITPEQEITLYDVAQFLKNNSNTSVKIEGYADKQTGTPAINKAISKKRASTVEQRLIKKYGISKNRIISSWKGDQEQPYPFNNWNRVVILTVVDSK